MWTIFLAACSSDTTHVYDDNMCVATLEPVADDDASLGFTAAEVVDLLRANLPSSVEWDELSLGAESASVAMVVDGIAGEVAVARWSGNCVKEPALRVPVDMTVTLAGGDVAGTGPVAIDATALDTDAIFPFAVPDHVPVELAGDYFEDFERHHAEGHYADHAVSEFVFVGTGAWADGYVDIEARYDSAGAVEAVWRGHWVLPPE
jgi:hypothetical protein